MFFSFTVSTSCGSESSVTEISLWSPQMLLYQQIDVFTWLEYEGPQLLSNLENPQQRHHSWCSIEKWTKIVFDSIPQTVLVYSKTIRLWILRDIHLQQSSLSFAVWRASTRGYMKVQRSTEFSEFHLFLDCPLTMIYKRI